MRHMMPAMPAIDRRHGHQRLPPTLRMHIPSRPIGFRQRFQQHHPSAMQRLQQRQRNLRTERSRLQLRPLRLLIGLNRRPIFSQRQPHAHISVDVAVSHMMGHLAHRPSILAIRSIQLIVIQTGNSRAQGRRQSRDRGDVLRPVQPRPVKLADGIAKGKRGIQRRRKTHALEGITPGREKNAVLRVVMVAVMVMPVMAPVVARRLRLRSHRSEQEQEQEAKRGFFHTLRVPPENDLPITLRSQNFGAVTVSKPRRLLRVALSQLCVLPVLRGEVLSSRWQVTRSDPLSKSPIYLTQRKRLQSKCHPRSSKTQRN